jgi:hypothetical protein
MLAGARATRYAVLHDLSAKFRAPDNYFRAEQVPSAHLITASELLASEVFQNGDTPNSHGCVRRKIANAMTPMVGRNQPTSFQAT